MACRDSVDNDLDGLVDAADPDCVGYCVEVCGNAIDDDGDSLVDCYDPDCRDACPEDCSNRLDDDHNGLIDCADPRCDGQCPEASRTGDGTIGFAPCSDGRDNDGDGRTDLGDARCWPDYVAQALSCLGRPALAMDERFDDGTWTTRWLSRAASPAVTPAGAARLAPDLASRLNRTDPALLLPAGGPGVLVGDRVVRDAILTSERPLDVAEIGISSFGVVLGSHSTAVVAVVPEWEIATLASIEDVIRAAIHYAAIDTISRSVAVDGVGAVILDDGVYDLEVGTTATLRAGAIATPVADLLVPTRATTGGLVRVVLGLRASEAVDGTDPSSAALDDVRVESAFAWPCGHASPEIPGPATADSCAALVPVTSSLPTGRLLGAARTPTGELCAAVSEGTDESSPTGVRLWSSVDGRAWVARDLLTGPVPNARLASVGLALRADLGADEAVLAWTSPTGSARVEARSVEGCAHFGPAETVTVPRLPTVPPEMVYSIREVEGQRRHELWWRDSTAIVRAVSSDGRTYSAPQVAFESSSDSAFTVASFGAADVALAQLRGPSVTPPGVDLWIATNDDATAWTAAGLVQPVLRFESDALRATSALGLVATAEQTQALLLLGAETPRGLAARDDAPLLAVSTAVIDIIAEPRTSVGVGAVERRSCGRTCAGGLCDVCPTECGYCAGELVDDDLLARGTPTSVVAAAAHPFPYSLAAAVSYSVGDGVVVDAVPSGSVWETRAVDVSGDFELRFDARIESASCGFLIGLGRRTGDEVTGSFVRMGGASACDDPSLTAVELSTTETLASVACEPTARVRPGLRHRISLRRTGTLLSVTVLDAHGCPLRAPVPVTLDAGASPDATLMLVGSAGDSSCSPGDAVVVENVMLLTSGCAERCGGRCTNTPTATAHCGGCAVSCDVSESCSAGACGCTPPQVDCGGACVDVLSDDAHCGACGSACIAPETCLGGRCATPGGETCEVATTWPSGVTQRTVSLAGATADVEHGCFSGPFGAPDRTVRWLADRTGRVRVSAEGSTRSVGLRLQVFEGASCTTTSLLSCAPLSPGLLPPETASADPGPPVEVSFDAVVGSSYTFVVSSRDPATESALLTILAP